MPVIVVYLFKVIHVKQYSVNIGALGFAQLFHIKIKIFAVEKPRYIVNKRIKGLQLQAYENKANRY